MTCWMFVSNSVGVAEHHELRSLEFLTFCVGSCILSKCLDKLIEIVWLVKERLAAVAVVVVKWSSAQMRLQSVFHILWHCFGVVPMNSSDLWWHWVWTAWNDVVSSGIGSMNCWAKAYWQVVSLMCAQYIMGVRRGLSGLRIYVVQYAFEA